MEARTDSDHSGPIVPLDIAAPRILVIRPRKIGDTLLITPLLRALRRAYPGGTLIALTQSPCDQVLKDNPHLDAVWTYPANGSLADYYRLTRRLRNAAFDVAIDAMGTPATARVAWATGARRRIGLNRRGRAWAYTDRVAAAPSGTYVAESHRVFLAPLGIGLDSSETEMFPDFEDERFADAVLQALPSMPESAPLVAFGPAVAQAYKRWPAENFARVADGLIQNWGARILFVHGPGEEDTVSAVRRAMVHQALPPAPPTRTLTQLAALLGRCDLFVGNDTGTRHIAIAMGVPTVGIFGRGRPVAWTPPGDSNHRALEFDPGCKSRCTYPRCNALPCLTEITPKAVLREADSLIVQGRNRRRLDRSA